MAIDISVVRTQLKKLSEGEQEYAQFNKRIVNSSKTFLGVRLPAMRQLAKSLARSNDARDIEKYLKELNRTVYEEVLLAGLTISYTKLDFKDYKHLAEIYLKLTDNWAEIDSFVAKRKALDQQPSWDFARECLRSSHEFTVRYGIIEMMSNFLNDVWINKVFEELRNVQHDGYYVKMALAWLYAESAVNYFGATLKELSDDAVDVWVKKKAFQKMSESLRFNHEQQETIRNHRLSLGLRSRSGK